jgi:hypothetical protein
MDSPDLDNRPRPAQNSPMTPIKPEHAASRDSRGLTPLQAKFVDAYLACGGYVKAAATAAGILPDNGSRMLGYAHVQTAISAAIDRQLKCDMAGLALGTMRDLLTDKEAPAHVRFQAARWTLEAAGHGAPAQPTKPGGKSLPDMSLAELDDFIQQSKAALEAMAPIDIEHATPVAK